MTVVTIFFMLLGNFAHSAVPLTIEADLVGENLDFMWRTGHFLTVSKKTSQSMKPLEDDKIHPVPADIDKWENIGKECSDTENYTFQLGEMNLQIRSKPILEKKIISIQVYYKDLLIAENTIPRMVSLCSFHVVQADQVIGPELIVTWKMSESINGVTIFRIPETIQR